MGFSEAFTDLNAKFVETVNGHDPRRWAALFSEDAVLIPAGQPSVTGRAGIEMWAEGAMKIWNHLEIHDGGSCSTEGDVVWEQGTWTGNINVPTRRRRWTSAATSCSSPRRRAPPCASRRIRGASTRPCDSPQSRWTPKRGTKAAARSGLVVQMGSDREPGSLWPRGGHGCRERNRRAADRISHFAVGSVGGLVEGNEAGDLYRHLVTESRQAQADLSSPDAYGRRESGARYPSAQVEPPALLAIWTHTRRWKTT